MKKTANFLKSAVVFSFTAMMIILAAGWSYAAAGMITTVAGNGIRGYSGDGGPATSAEFSGPRSLAVDYLGNIYISDAGGNNVIRKVNALTGIITTVAGNGVIGYSGDGGPATSAAFHDPRSVAVDHFGNIFITDRGNNVIRKVDASTEIITTVAGNGIRGYSGDGGPATSAELGGPFGIAVDDWGNIYICDNNTVIRKINASTGIITTVAGNGIQGYSGDGGPATSAELGRADGVAVDHFGNIFIADEGNNAIREVSASTGIITTAAGNGIRGYSGDGGPATSAKLNTNGGIAVDNWGNIYIADSGNNVIRKVDALTGIITTVAGNGIAGYSGDGGPATAAELNWDRGVAVDNQGNIYVADTGNLRIRKVAMQIPTTLPDLLAFVNSLLSSGAIDNSGVANSLTAKLNNALAAGNSGNLQKSNNILQAFINEVSAQSGKHISTDAATALINSANFIMSH